MNVHPRRRLHALLVNHQPQQRRTQVVRLLVVQFLNSPNGWTIHQLIGWQICRQAKQRRRWKPLECFFDVLLANNSLGNFLFWTPNFLNRERYLSRCCLTQHFAWKAFERQHVAEECSLAQPVSQFGYRNFVTKICIAVMPRRDRSHPHVSRQSAIRNLIVACQPLQALLDQIRIPFRVTVFDKQVVLLVIQKRID